MMTWRVMSEVRAHGEDLFLMFLPESERDRLPVSDENRWLMPNSRFCSVHYWMIY